MLKALTDFLHRTPWWGLITFGLATLIVLVLLAVPFNVIRLETRGGTPAEKRAVQREVDAAFGNSALSLAEHAVEVIQRFSQDPVRQMELEGALDQIARGRREIEARSEERDKAPPVAAEGSSGARREAEPALDLGAELDAAKDAYETAVDARGDIEQSHQELLDRLKDNEVPETEWPPSLGTQLEAARTAEHAARERIEAARARQQAARNRERGEQKPLAPGAEGAKAGELSAALRQEIRDKVASDFFRIAVGTILVLLFIPAFMVVAIAKFFIDRARSSQQFAEQKSYEAERNNIQRQLIEARLQALQAQVEPHFLYNTLANVQALIEVDPPSAGVMVGHLIEYLRAALPKMRESISTVAQEAELARAYLSILKMRMGERLEFSIEVAPQAASCALPPLMLPSLVENAIKHGLEPLRDGGRVDIFARIEDGKLVVGVRDSGRGLQADKEVGGGVGLSNIRERLEAMFGTAAALTLEENLPRGTVARIVMPLSAPMAAAGGRVSGAALRPVTLELPVAAPPRSIAARASVIMGNAHRFWRRFIVSAYAITTVVLAVALFVLLIASVAGALPMQIGDVELTGINGLVVAALSLLAAFGVLSLVMLIVFAVFYGVGILLTGLLLLVPLIIAFALAPPLAPFVLFGLLIYWYMRKRRSTV